MLHTKKQNYEICKHTFKSMTLHTRRVITAGN